MIRQTKAKYSLAKTQKKKDELMMQEQSRKTAEIQTTIDGLDVMISQLMQENKQLQLEIDNTKGQNEKLQQESVQMDFQAENDQELRKQIESTIELQRQRRKNLLAEETAAEEAIVQLKEMVEILES